MGITISKRKNPQGKVKTFYRVKNDGVYLQDFKTKVEAVRYANTKRSKYFTRQITFWKKTRHENAPRKRIVPLTLLELKYFNKYGNVEPFEKRILIRQGKL